MCLIVFRFHITSFCRYIYMCKHVLKLHFSPFLSPKDISAKAELKTPAGQVVVHQSALPNASDYENGGTITELGACLLAQGLLECSKLRVLRIGDHNLGRGASRIMASLAHNGNIEELDMKRCSIHYCPDFFQHLASFRKLESLDISSNQFDGVGHFGRDDRVADIEDFCNTLHTSDMVSFFKILPSLHTLRRVNLSNIDMSDEAISVLKDVLSNCPGVCQCMRVNMCRCMYACVCKLVHELKSCCHKNAFLMLDDHVSDIRRIMFIDPINDCKQFHVADQFLYSDQMNIRMESCGLSVFNTLCSKTTSWCGTMPQDKLDLNCGTLPRYLVVGAQESSS